MAYLIGMHQMIDKEKFERDHDHRISGIEFCNFPTYEDAKEAVAFAKRKGTDFAVHFPLCKESYKYRDPHVTAVDDHDQEEAFEAIARECHFAKEHDAKYILLHFPKPIVVPSTGEFDAISMHDYEVIYDHAITYETFALRCEKAFKYLNKLSKHYDLPIVLELDLMMPWLYETSLLEVLLVRYPHIKLCIDLARCHVQEAMDSRFDAKSFIQRYSPFAYVAHVSNLRIKDGLHQRHYPAMEHYNPKEGWGDLTPMLQAFQSKPNYVLFEHQSSHLSPNELNDCYEYVMSHL